MASPTLLFNVNGGIISAGMTVCLRASPFGSRHPAIPMARTMTIARVASPLSTDRAYQPLFLQALKRYFNGDGRTKRLLKQGDIICTDIDADHLRRVSSWPTDETISDLDTITHRSVLHKQPYSVHLTTDTI
jgi:peroxin-6